MSNERTLVLIKPDAMVKNLHGTVLSELSKLNLKMIGLKLVNVDKQLAEMHYEEHKGKPFLDKLIKHLTGDLHGKENVIAICYEGENAIKAIREAAGSTHPEEANPNSIRGRYGRVHHETDCYENVIHASDGVDSANREISQWFKPEELIK